MLKTNIGAQISILNLKIFNVLFFNGIQDL